MAAPVRESWATAVHQALAGFHDVLVCQLVPGEARYELVLTTRTSPPDRVTWHTYNAVLQIRTPSSA